MISERAFNRAAALEAAAMLVGPVGHHDDVAVRRVTLIADAYYSWLTRPPHAIRAEIVAGPPTPKGSTMSLVMPDNDQVTLSAAAEDAEGVVVPGNTFTDPAGPFLAPFTWAVSDATIAGVTPAADTLSVVFASLAGQVGTVTVTATDVNGKAMAPFTVQVDPSAAVTAGIVAGTPVARTAAPATPAPPAATPAA